MRAAGAVAALLLAGFVLAACGGGQGSESAAASAQPPPRIRARADAICRNLLREVEAIGAGALRNPPATTLELTTERLVRPSVPVLRRAATRLGALESAAHSRPYSLFTDLFDPFLVLTEKRLRAGREGDGERSRGLEEQLTDLSLTQRRAAHLAGLRDCDIDFPHALLESLSE